MNKKLQKARKWNPIFVALKYLGLSLFAIAGVGLEAEKMVGDTFPSLMLVQDQLFHVFGAGIWKKTILIKLHINYTPMNFNYSELSWKMPPQLFLPPSFNLWDPSG